MLTRKTAMEAKRIGFRPRFDVSTGLEESTSNAPIRSDNLPYKGDIADEARRYALDDKCTRMRP